MTAEILKVLLMLAVVWCINLTFKDSRSRRHYRNILKEPIAADTMLLNRYDSIITTYRK